MALVNLLRFDRYSGGIIADEEHWNVYMRKRMQGDNLHSLLTPEMSELRHLEVVYGAVGYPSFHREVIRDARRALASGEKHSGGLDHGTVKYVARIAFDCMKSAVRRRIDQKLLLFFGFDTRDLHRGYFMSGGRKVSIRADEVKKAAAKIAEGETKDTLLKPVFGCRATVFGRDDVDGVTAYYLSPDKWILGYNHEGFEAIGAGKYASGMIFGRDFLRKNFSQRQAGYSPAEGVFELVLSGMVAGDHFKEVGGNINMVLIDGRGKSHAQRYREIFDERARLTVEIVRGVWGEQLSRDRALELIEKLLFRDGTIEEVEELLFAAAESRLGLEMVLRRYKLNEIREITDRQLEKTKRQSGKRGRK